MFEKILQELKSFLGEDVSLRINHNLTVPKEGFVEYPQRLELNYNNYRVEVLMASQPLTEKEKKMIFLLIKKSLEMMQTSGKQLVLDPEGYTRYQKSLEFPLRLWHVEFKNNFDDVYAILKSVFETDEIIIMNNNEIIVFVTHNEASPYEIIEMLESEALTTAKITVGNVCTHIGEVHASYRQIIDLKKIGNQIKINHQVLIYDQLMMPYLLWQLKHKGDREIVEIIFKNQVKKLGDEELEQTAINFFENNLNVTETANKLYIHRNTLIYRLNKIEAITGYDIRKFSDAMNFYLNFLIGKLL